MATVIVPPGTKDLSTVDPGSGTDPHAWYFYEGDQVITAGTNFSARAAQTSFFFDSTAPVTFAATLRLGIASSLISRAKGGFLSIQADDSGSNTIAQLQLLGGMKIVDVGGGTWSDVQVTGGDLTIAESTALTAYDQAGGSHTIGYNATGPTTFNVRGGILHMRRGLADNTVAYIGGKSFVYFRRAQQVASSGIAIGGTGELHIGDSGYVKWCGAAINKVVLDSDNAIFDWQDMPTAATIAAVTGSAKAIARVGLRQGAVNVLKNGAILTVTALTPKGGNPDNYVFGPEGVTRPTM